MRRGFLAGPLIVALIVVLRNIGETAVLDIITVSPLRFPNGHPAASQTFVGLTNIRPVEQRPSLEALPFIVRTAVVLCEAGEKGSALDVLLGRVRESLEVVGPCVGRWWSSRDQFQEFLENSAPAWHACELNVTFASLRRRQRLFAFAVTGGNDRRANYVEWTWGQRTPIQWFADSWSEALRPVVSRHPLYDKDKFYYLTMKLALIWRRVYVDYFSSMREPFDWYIRLWDDNYFLEENVHMILSRIPIHAPKLAGKIGWRNMGKDAVFPFAGGGAGWFLNQAGMALVGPSWDEGEAWFVRFRARRDIYLPHGMHDEDVFLTAWFHLLNVTFVNIPGVEHVSPGLGPKQRCLTDDALKSLRINASARLYYDYPSAHPSLVMDGARYAYAKPIVWHYMSPRRLERLEGLIYPARTAALRALPAPPLTAADVPKRTRRCYPGTPQPPPPEGGSVFEKEPPPATCDPRGPDDGLMKRSIV